MDSSNFQANRWGHPFNLNHEQTAVWDIGPLHLAVRRLAGEWQLAYRRSDPFAEDYTNWTLQLSNNALVADDYLAMERFVFGQTDALVQLTPLLADRPFVTRPIVPMFVPAGEETSIFISSPLWVAVEVGAPPRRLQEIAVYRPSDTWFGPSTMEGELCYASRTHGRLNFDNIPRQPHRAYTQVIIRNLAAGQLAIERFSLPVPYLSLFEAEDGLLWTELVTLAHTRDTEMATMQLEKAPPALAQNARQVASPRQHSGHNMLVRAFGSLFGG
ncbi:MAG: hypothetical protein FOGNACKC_05439 [Anaerolineae bacterium]|nr:hypothetical protein [Anaerolineae bacterium]